MSECVKYIQVNEDVKNGGKLIFQEHNIQIQTSPVNIMFLKWNKEFKKINSKVIIKRITNNRADN